MGESAVKRSFPPVADARTRLFILGSLPGEASLAAGRYYAHPRNQFWRLLGGVLGEELATLAYEARLERLRARGVGLWDVVGAAERVGSLDAAMRGIVANDLSALRRDYPLLRAIAFNGGKATTVGRRALGSGRLALVDLPSSSPAYTLAIAEKAARWAALAPFID